MTAIHPTTCGCYDCTPGFPATMTRVTKCRTKKHLTQMQKGHLVMIRARRLKYASLGAAP